MKKGGLNTQRILLLTLVAVAFSGFLLWSIAQSQEEQEAIISEAPLVRNGLASNKMIKVMSPSINSAIGNPAAITVNAKEGTYKIKIKDAKSLTLGEATAQVKKGQTSFSLSLKYKKASAATGLMEVYKIGANNAQLYRLSFPIAFKK